jgi:hemolysin activation/secretion protein
MVKSLNCLKLLLVLCAPLLAQNLTHLSVYGETDEALEKELNAQFLGKKIDTELLQGIKQSIAGHFQKRCKPFVETEIPEQDVTDGNLALKVSTSRVGEVIIEGNTWSSSEILRKDLSFQPGDEINTQRIKRDVCFMNSNPFRRVNVVYAPGKRPYTTDLILQVNERRPYRVYMGADNTGIPTILRQRLFTGFSVTGEAGGCDHVFSGQYTTAYNFSAFWALTGQYQLLLPNRQIVELYGGYSSIHTKLSFPSMKNTGFGSQASLRYLIPFVLKNINQRVSFGFDYKRTNNTVLFSELFANFAQSVNLTQFMAAYQLSKTEPRYQVLFDTQMYWSPGAWLPQQTNEDYNSLQPGAVNHWFYNRTEVSYLQYLAWDTSIWLSLRGQVSSQTLLPSEQIGLGGYDTVRGYDQRQLNYDDGLIANFEFRSPHIPMVSLLRGRKVQDALQFLAFFDLGYGADYHAIDAEPNNDYLIGIGPGVRYVLDPYLSMRLDWGIKLHNQSVMTGGGSMLHFSVIANY